MRRTFRLLWLYVVAAVAAFWSRRPASFWGGMRVVPGRGRTHPSPFRLVEAPHGLVFGPARPTAGQSHALQTC